MQINKFYYQKGGSETYLFGIEEALRRLGHEVIQFSMLHPKNRKSNWENYFVNKIDYENSSFSDQIKNAINIIYSLEAKRKIGRLLKKVKPDIAHLHIFQHQLSSSILPEIKKMNIPIVYTAHDLKSICPSYKMLCNGKVCERCRGHKYYNCFVHRCTKGSYIKSLINTVEMYAHLWLKYYDLIDVIIAPSYFYKNKLIEFRFSSDKVIHLPNFVDLDNIRPTFEYQKYFVYYGRLSKEKGLLTLIKAMQKINNLQLVIVGNGPMNKILVKQVEDLGLQNVKFAGFQSGSNLYRLIGDSMFSVLPSEWYENGPMSLLESFAHGKPVVGADIGGIPEYINDNEDGIIFKPGNADDLSEKINRMIDNPIKTIKMGKNARCKAEQIYSKEQHVQKILEIYENCIKAKRNK